MYRHWHNKDRVILRPYNLDSRFNTINIYIYIIYQDPKSVNMTFMPHMFMYFSEKFCMISIQNVIWYYVRNHSNLQMQYSSLIYQYYPLLSFIVYLWQLIHLYSIQKSECFNKVLHYAFNYADLTPVNCAADVILMMPRNTISSGTLYLICIQSMNGNASRCACYWIWAPLIPLSVFGIIMFCCLSK